ncbi:hypothetical protein K1719_042797 [Acacia pycnantha]|nr:hypothetical protein K1719_042797 [Acacia pycnantha]
MEGQEDEVSNQSQQQNERPHPFKPKRSCNKYWVVDVKGIPFNIYVTLSEERLRIRDVLVLPPHKQVVVTWSEENQPVGDGGSLLNGYLGHLACNTNVFPICYDRWPKVPRSYKDNAWEMTIQVSMLFQFHFLSLNDCELIFIISYCEKNFVSILDEHYEYCLANMGKKWKDNRWRLCNYYYDSNASYEQNLENYPEGMTREQWAGFWHIS